MLRKISIHCVIIFTAVMVTLFILDYLNPLMGFLTRGISKLVMALWILSGIMFIATLKNKKH